MTEKCDCGQFLVPPRGPKNSAALIISEFPGKDELEQLRPFVGAAGRILRSELALIGVDMLDLRITNMWMHTPNEQCQEWHYQQAIQEARGRKVILLLGSDVVEYFTGYNVMAVSGMKVKSTLLSAKTIIAAPNPAQLFHKGVGEFRLALNNFAKALKESTLMAELGY